MTSLTGRAPKDTYKDLLQVSNSNTGIDATLRAVEDGEGTTSQFFLSTTGIEIGATGTLSFAIGAVFDTTNIAIHADDGSLALPAYSFATDVDTGWWLESAGDLRAGVGGVEILSITTAGLHVHVPGVGGLELHRTSNTVGHEILQVYRLEDSADAEVAYAQTAGGIVVNTPASEDGFLRSSVMSSGTLTDIWELDKTASFPSANDTFDLGKVTTNEMKDGFFAGTLNVGTSVLTDQIDELTTNTGVTIENIRLENNDLFMGNGQIEIEPTATTHNFMFIENSGGSLRQKWQFDSGNVEFVIRDGSDVVLFEFENVGDFSTLRDIQVGRDLVLQTSAGLTAFSGGGQGSAIQLITGINEIATCAVAGDSVKLVGARAGLTTHIINNGIAACDVFPATGDDIGAGVNAAVSLGIGAGITYASYDATNWRAV